METNAVTNKKQPVRPRSLGRQLNFAAGATTGLCNAMLATHDLTLPQWIVLAALWQSDNLTVGEVAAYSGNNIPATSRILDRMIEKNVIARRSDPKDRRAVRITLTDTGEGLRHLQDFHQTVNKILESGLTSQEALTLSRLLDKVEQNARGWIRPE